MSTNPTPSSVKTPWAPGESFRAVRENKTGKLYWQLRPGTRLHDPLWRQIGFAVLDDLASKHGGLKPSLN